MKPYTPALGLSLVALLISAPFLGAQAVTAPAASKPVENPPPKEEVTVALSPFEVHDEKDNGYYAANTMSGTRISSRVEDLGASITVITKQQMLDTAAVDLNDLFKYEANTEGTTDFNAAEVSAQGTFGNVNDKAQASPATANRMRGISPPNIAINNFASTARIPIDTYNLDSVEIDRGPSSTLFGLGSPSGTVNINRASASTTKQNARLELRGDSYGGYRATLNFNEPLIKDRLGIRIATLTMDNAYKQKPAYDRANRIYGAFTYTPFKNTIIKGSYEKLREERQTPNSITPWDGITAWLQAGKPVWNPTTATYTLNGVTSKPIPVGSGATSETITLPPGLWAQTSIYGRPTVYVDEGGAVKYFSVNRLSTTGSNPNVVASDARMMMTGQMVLRGDTQHPLNSPLHVSNKAIYDWTSENAAAVNWNNDDASLYNFEVQQKLAPNLYLRGAWFLAASDSFNRNGANLSGPNLVMDVNTTFMDGTPNPFFMRPYFYQLEAPINRQPEYNDNLQAQLAYEWNPGATHGGWMKWLGRHRMLGYYESRHVSNGTYRYRDGIVDKNHVWDTAGVSLLNGPQINRPTFNYYVGQVGSLGYQDGYNLAKSGTTGTYDLHYYNAATKQWVAEPATLGMGTYQDNQSRQETTSRGLVLQSSLLDDRIVFTGGLRHDFNRVRASAASTIDPNTGFANDASLSNWGAWTNADGTTRTASVVVRPLRWLGLTYNHSDSFQPTTLAFNLFGKSLPNPTGTGHDIGFDMDLLDHKLIVSLRVYKNEVSNSRLATGSPITSRVVTLESSTNSYALSTWATGVATAKLGAGASASQIQAAVAAIMQLPAGTTIQPDGSGTSQTISALTDLEGTGGELEVNYNPVPNWNMKFTGAQTKSVVKTVDEDIRAYLAIRLPFWQGLKDAAGNSYWTSGGTNSPATYYAGNIAPVLTLDQAMEGKSNQQIKKYTWRFLTNYRVTEGRFKNVAVGGTVRWNDRSAIGYLGGAPDSDGIVRTYDPNKPVYDPATYSADFWTSYRMRLFSNRISAKVQLNLLDAFQNGRILAIKVNPDGTPSNFRIVNPRKLVLTTSFEY